MALPLARSLALQVLALTLDRGQDLQAALDQVLSQAAPSSPETVREAALATELAYGFLRLKGRVDHVLSLFLRDAGRLHPGALRAMALAAHEILHLDSIPPRASVHWAVDAAKALAGARVAGVANAVLRKAADLGDAVRDPGLFRRDAPSETVFLSRWLSCPEWIVDLWVRSFGRERAEALLTAQTQAPPLGLWVPPAGPGADALLQALAARPDCLMRLDRGLAFAAGTSLAELEGTVGPGLLVRQSLAAQQALLAFGPEVFAGPGPVWDCCAGRGNKTRQVLALADGPVLASDVHAGRLKALRRELGGHPRLLAVRASAVEEPPLKDRPGLVLADAPCSGLGVLARRPDGKWKRTPADLAALARIQASILDRGCAALRPGGRLFFLTCTLNPGENEDQVAAFLSRTPGARLAGTWTTPPDSPLREFFFAALVEKA